MIAVSFPMRLRNWLNVRAHWAVRAGAVRGERHTTRLMLSQYEPPALPVHVTITRLAPKRGLIHDDDGVVASCKAVRDGVADWLGVGDAMGNGVTWRAQQETAKDYGVRVEVREA